MSLKDTDTIQQLAYNYTKRRKFIKLLRFKLTKRIKQKYY